MTHTVTQFPYTDHHALAERWRRIHADAIKALEIASRMKDKPKERDAATVIGMASMNLLMLEKVK